MSTIWVVTKSHKQFVAFSNVIKMKDPAAAARLAWLNNPGQAAHIHGRPNVAILGGAWENEHFDDILNELEQLDHYRAPSFNHLLTWRVLDKTVPSMWMSMKDHGRLCKSEQWAELRRYGRRAPWIK